MNRQLFVVAGMHRSGTSTFARMLAVFDVPLGANLRPPADDNPRGFWEDEVFVEFNDRLLDALGLNWASLDGFFLEPEDFRADPMDALKEEAKALLIDRFEGRERWGLKDPRICRLLAFWQPIFAELSLDVTYLLPLRSPLGVAASLIARNDLGLYYSQLLWALYTLDLVANLADERVRISSFETMLDDPRAELQRLAPLFGNDAPSEEAIAAFADDFLDAGLNHGPPDDAATRLAVADDLFGSLSAAIDGDDRLARSLVGAALAHRDQWRAEGTLRLVSSDERRVRREMARRLTALENRRTQATIDFQHEERRLQKTISALDRSVEFHKRREEQRLKDARGLQTALDEASAVIEADRGAREALQEQLDKSEAQLDEAEADRRSIESELSHARRSLVQTAEELHAVHASRSWRLTRPLRGLGRAVRRATRFLGDELPARSEPWRRVVERYRAIVARAGGESAPLVFRASHASTISRRTNVDVGPAFARPPTPLPDLDVSIVTYNSSRWVDQFIASLKAQNYPLEKLHVVVVDHDSSDDTVARFEAHASSLRPMLGSFAVIQAPNKGFGAGHNRGVGAGSAEFALVTNVDLEYTDDALTTLVGTALADDPSVVSWECRQQPHEHPKFYDPVSGDTSWSSHACVLFRRSAFEEAGGYEERIFMYGEDVELSYRLRSLGYRLRYLPASVVWHHTYETPGEHKPLQFEGSTLANAYLRLRYGSRGDALAVIPMFARLLRFFWRMPEQRRQVIRNIGKIAGNAAHFVRERRRSTVAFAFREWDYEMVRDGAFYEPPAAEVVEAPLVSIVTRTYRGRGELLRQSMLSVLNQTWPAIELIVVEDGGATLQPLVEEMAARSSGRSVRFVEMPKVGRCVAGNAGLDAAGGQYLMFLDDDDLLFADHVETCVHELLADAELGGVYALSWELLTRFDDALPGGYEELSMGTAQGLRQEFDRDVITHHNFIPIQSALFRRELYERFGGFDPELENLEDWNLWLRYSSERDFRLIQKTTSMFRTPWADDERLRRQEMLDAYYETASAKNRAFIEQLETSAVSTMIGSRPAS